MRPRRSEIERELARRRALADVEREMVDSEMSGASGKLTGEFHRAEIAAGGTIARRDVVHQRGEARVLDVDIERHARARRRHIAGDMRATAEHGKIGGAGKCVRGPVQLAAEAERTEAAAGIEDGRYDMQQALELGAVHVVSELRAGRAAAEPLHRAAQLRRRPRHVADAHIADRRVAILHGGRDMRVAERLAMPGQRVHMGVEIGIDSGEQHWPRIIGLGRSAVRTRGRRVARAADRRRD